MMEGRNRVRKRNREGRRYERNQERGAISKWRSALVSQGRIWTEPSSRGLYTIFADSVMHIQGGGTRRLGCEQGRFGALAFSCNSTSLRFAAGARPLRSRARTGAVNLGWRER